MNGDDEYEEVFVPVVRVQLRLAGSDELVEVPQDCIRVEFFPRQGGNMPIPEDPVNYELYSDESEESGSSTMSSPIRDATEEMPPRLPTPPTVVLPVELPTRRPTVRHAYSKPIAHFRREQQRVRARARSLPRRQLLLEEESVEMEETAAPSENNDEDDDEDWVPMEEEPEVPRGRGRPRKQPPVQVVKNVVREVPLVPAAVGAPPVPPAGRGHPTKSKSKKSGGTSNVPMVADWTKVAPEIKQIGLGDEQGEYFVERVRDVRFEGEGRLFLVKWWGWDELYDSWEKEESFGGQTPDTPLGKFLLDWMGDGKNDCKLEDVLAEKKPVPGAGYFD